MNPALVTALLSGAIAVVSLAVAYLNNRQQGQRADDTLDLQRLNSALEAQDARIEDLKQQVDALRHELDEERQARRATGHQLRMAIDYVHVLLAFVAAHGNTAPDPPPNLQLDRYW